jgi:hypothetical protein
MQLHKCSDEFNNNTKNNMDPENENETSHDIFQLWILWTHHLMIYHYEKTEHYFPHYFCFFFATYILEIIIFYINYVRAR